MDQHKAYVCTEIDGHAEELRKLADRIWKFAEIGGQEVQTVKALTRFLKKKDFKVTNPLHGMPTAFKAEFGEKEFGGRPRPNIAILCHYDAVRGKGHVKGNNLVAEAAVAAALGVQAVIQASSTRIGKVTVVGCPNAEGGGVVTLLNRKAFRDVDVALTAVPGPRTEWCPIYRGRKTFQATYKGWDPQPGTDSLATNPLDAAVLACTNVSAIHQHFGQDWLALNAIRRGGQGVEEESPKECEALVKMMGPSNIDMALLERRVGPCLEAAAQATGCEMELKLSQKPYFSLISNVLLTYLLQLNAYFCGVLATPLKVKAVMDPVDVANVSHVIPTIRPMFYIGSDAEVGTPEFKTAARTVEAQAYTLGMAKALAMTAVDVLHTPDTLDKVKLDLKTTLQGERAVKFSPFHVDKVPNYFLRCDLPADTNTGWSKQV